MTGEQLREVFGKIDDEFIEEAENYVPEHKCRKPIYIIAPASAAAIAICAGVSYYNSAGAPHRTEISNSYTVTTTFTESKVFEEIPEKTNEPDIIADGINLTESEVVNTEITATGNNGVTQPDSDFYETTKIPHEAEISSDEGTVQNAETAAIPHSYTEPAESNIPDVGTVPDTLNISETEANPNYPVVQVQVVTSHPVSDITEISDSVTLSESEISIEKFPLILKTSDGVIYTRFCTADKDQVGRFIKKETFTANDGSTYELSEYALKDALEQMIVLLYFEEYNSFVGYMNDSYKPSRH